MDANTYQREAARTLIDAPPRPLTDWEHMVVWNALGLVGEAGEVFYLRPRSPDAQNLLWRAAQLAEHVKKGIFHERGLDRPLVHNLLELIGHAAAHLWYLAPPNEARATLCKELGDVCWYLTALCTKFDWSLADVLRIPDALTLAPVLQTNIDKLRVRFPVGWSTADAAARVDVALPALLSITAEDGTAGDT